MANFKKKQFCPRGHDTFKCGRTTQRRCRKCGYEDMEKRYIPHPYVKKTHCIHGHDIAIVGRDRYNGCNGCKKPVSLGLRPSRSKTQFCPKGHDKEALGRTKCGGCRECGKERSRTKEHKKRLKRWRKEHKDKVIKHNKTFYQKHKKRLLKQQHVYTIEHREQTNKRARIRLKKDPSFKLKHYLRSRLTRAIRNKAKKGSAVEDLGCSIEFFITYIAKKFHGKMTWKNWGKVWELDHIKALFKFDLENRAQFLKAVNYKNMQPLTIKEHREKTNKEMIEWQESINKK